MLVQFILYALVFLIIQLVFNVISMPLAFWLLRVLMLFLFVNAVWICIINIFCLVTTQRYYSNTIKAHIKYAIFNTRGLFVGIEGNRMQVRFGSTYGL